MKYIIINFLFFVFTAGILAQGNDFDIFEKYRSEHSDVIMSEIFPEQNPSKVELAISDYKGKTYIELNAQGESFWIGETLETERYFKPITTPHIFYAKINDQLDVVLVQSLRLGFSSRVFIKDELYFLDKINLRNRPITLLGNVHSILPYEDGLLIYQEAGGIYGARLHKIYTYVHLSDSGVSMITEIIDREIPFKKDLKK